MQIVYILRYLLDQIFQTMLYIVSKLVLFFSGWKVVGEPPKDKKYLLVVGPHTSAWDFVYGLAAKGALRLPTLFVGKAELFSGVGGFFFRMVGGYPVDRFKSGNKVDFVVNIFNSHDEISFAMSPEGTRSYLPELRTGFYYIAKGAGVPIYMVGLDFKEKMVTIDPEPFYAGEDMQADLDRVKEYFGKFTAKYPEKVVGVRE